MRKTNSKKFYSVGSCEWERDREAARQASARERRRPAPGPRGREHDAAVALGERVRVHWQSGGRATAVGLRPANGG